VSHTGRGNVANAVLKQTELENCFFKEDLLWFQDFKKIFKVFRLLCFKVQRDKASQVQEKCLQ